MHDRYKFPYSVQELDFVELCYSAIYPKIT